MKPRELYQCTVCGEIYDDFQQARDCCNIEHLTEIMKTVEDIQSCWRNKVKEINNSQQKYILAKVMLSKIKESEYKWRANGYKKVNYNGLLAFKSDLNTFVQESTNNILNEFIRIISDNCESIDIGNEHYFVHWEDIVESLQRMKDDEDFYEIEINKKINKEEK